MVNINKAFTPNSVSSMSIGNQSPGILDDYATRKDIQTISLSAQNLNGYTATGVISGANLFLSGYLSIGTSSTLYREFIQDIHSSATSKTTKSSQQFISNPTANSSLYITSQNVMTSNASNNLTGAYGSGGVIAGLTRVTNSGTGTITNAYTSIIDVTNTGAGSIINSYGIYLPNPTVSAGSITNSYGLYIVNPTTAGYNTPLFIGGGTSVIQGNVNLSGSAVYMKNGSLGVGGTFTTVDSKTVTVSGGIIISIV